MARRLATALSIALACLISGCGLLYDFEPPREGMDAGPGRDAGARDAGMRDAGPRDAGPPPTGDAGPRDAGPADDGAVERPDASPSDAGAADAGADAGIAPTDAGLDGGPPIDGGPPPDCEDVCVDPTRYCEYDANRCNGPARCQPRGLAESCPLTVDRVCGCDQRTYNNACLAAAAGTSVMFTGSCPSDIGQTTWCDEIPPADPPPPSGCIRCFDDDDCPDGVAQRCVAASCRPGGHGFCRFNESGLRDECYYDVHCDEGEVCVGAQPRGCPPSLIPSAQILGECMRL